MKLVVLKTPLTCAPCRDMDARIKSVLLRTGLDDSTIQPIDTSLNPKALDEYQVKVVPTILVIDDNGEELYRSTGRVSEATFERLLRWTLGEDIKSFSENAPSADVVFNRTYSRRRTENGQRESFPETMDRVITDIAKLGEFTSEEKELVLREALNQHTFPSGRWLWVGGTEWISKQKNFSGAYNCTSTNVDSPEAFGLMMELAMMGSGTGAVLEDEMVAQLPPMRVFIDLVEISDVGTEPGREETLVLETTESRTIIVGDSRQGWVDAYQILINMAMGLSYVQEEELEIKVKIDLSNVRPAGSKLKGFGGTANPVKLGDLFRRVVGVLNDANSRQLTPIEACLLIDEAATCIVAGNIRRSAGMRQFSWDNEEAANAKDGLYFQDEDGSWKVDPKREALRMANHTRCAHKKPSLEEVKAAVTKQFHSGEGAIQYVPEAVARANRDLLFDADEFQAFLEVYEEGFAREFLCSLIDVERPEMDQELKQAELDHRMQRYGLNPCGEIIGSDFHCNLAEVHLNQLDPRDSYQQRDAFRAAGLQVAALLHHRFKDARYLNSRELDPIVGVSFTGLFDFFVNKWGVLWLDWMMRGRPEGEATTQHLPEEEAKFLTFWRETVEKTIEDYCREHALLIPNRTTTVQPAGTKSLLTGASSGWHPPKSQRFIRRITVGANDPVALAALDYGYSVIPAQSARDEEGNLLDDIHDPRSTEWLIEIPTEVPWANKPGCDKYDLSQLSAAAQFGLYMQVQKHYTTHNTSATIEFREHEIDELSQLIHDGMGDGYISAALLARFDVDGGTFPRLPFEPISKEVFEDMVERVAIKGEACRSFEAALAMHDRADLELSAADGACTSAACVAKAEEMDRKGLA